MTILEKDGRASRSLGESWRHLVAAFRNREVEIEIPLYQIQRVYEAFNLEKPI